MTREKLREEARNIVRDIRRDLHRSDTVQVNRMAAQLLAAIENLADISEAQR